MSTTASSDKNNYNRPLGAAEEKQFIRNASLLVVLSLIFMTVSTFLVHFDVIRLHPKNTNADTVKGYAGRVEFTLRYQTLLLAWLVFNVFATIHGRLSNRAINPLEESKEQLVQARKNILTNSYEQIVISILAQLIFISYASPECILKAIPLVNIIQFVGRIAFYVGYPFKRSFGFFCTIVPTLFLVAYDVFKFISFIGLF